MKTKNVTSALNKILKGAKNERGQMIFVAGNRKIAVHDQGGNAIAFPIIVEADGSERVVHNGNYTIKNLVSFITDGLSFEKVEYLKTLRKMYSTTPNERLLEIATQYQSIGG